MTSAAGDDRLGKLAYDAYCTQTGGVSLVSGETLPPWDGLTGALQTAWITVGRAVEAHVRGQVETETDG
jgi:hypothetical protein